MTPSPEYLSLLFIALTITSLGFIHFIFFISLGYGLSVAGMAVGLLCLYHTHLNSLSTLICITCICYGLRLGFFLLLRDIKSKSYKEHLKARTAKSSHQSIFTKIMMWIYVSLLYTFQVSPIFYRLANHSPSDIYGIVGLFIQVAGLLLESIADQQKGTFKKVNPTKFCDIGLYRWVRCPNYLGEAVFWTGLFVSGIRIYSGVLQWFIASFGWACILVIMISAVRSLEKRQNMQYASDPHYASYIAQTPLFIPFLRFHSSNKQ